MKNEELAFKLESEHMVSWERGCINAPLSAVMLAKKESDCGVSTGFAYYEGKWYLIQTAGQGPFIVWEQECIIE